jgi:hypothetical protein
VDQARPTDGDIFDGGPPLGLQRRLRLCTPERRRTALRAVLIGLVAWLPVAVLTAAHGVESFRQFLDTVAVHVRGLVVIPMLVFAEAVCLPRLSGIAAHFRTGGFVPEAEQDRYEAARRSTVKLLTSPLAEIGVAVAAYVTVIAVLQAAPLAQLPGWWRTGEGRFSAAGLWQLLVSVPLMLVLLMGWLWRWLTWVRFLWLMSRLSLRLSPAHPDHAAGLKFVGYSAMAFAPLAFAFGAAVAGLLAEQVLARGPEPTVPKFAAFAGTAGAVLVLFVGPLGVFTMKLLREWRRGVFSYGELAVEQGRRFERRWLSQPRPADDDAMLGAPDFSSTTDLYSVTANVYAMRFLPVDRMSVLTLLAGVAAPFAPVVLLVAPADEILDVLKQLLF